MAIRELSAPAIHAAAEHGEIIGITNGRMMAAVLYPISPTLTEQLVYRSLSRVTRNIARGEQELDRTTGGDPEHDQVATLDDLITQASVPAVDLSASRRVNLRDISGRVLREAASAKQAITLTTDGVIAGVIVPLREEWVNQLIEDNLSRLLHTVKTGERQLQHEELTTLDDEA